MKYFFLIIALFSITSNLYASHIVVVQEGNGVRVPKYLYSEKYVWSDSQKTAMSSMVDTGTGAVTVDAAEFVNILPSNYDIALVTSTYTNCTYSGDGVFACTEFIKADIVSRLLNDQDYLEERLIEKQLRKQAISDAGITGTTKSKNDGELEMLKKRNTELNK